MVVCVGCPVLLLEMRRDWLPLRPGTTAAYFLRSFDRDAARELPTVDGMCFALHPFILLAARSWGLFPVRRMSMPTATMEISGSRVQNALAACNTLELEQSKVRLEL